MALLNRFSKLNDRAETGIFTFIVTKSVTRDLHRDATTKDFCFGYHRWAVSFQRPSERVLGVHLLLRNPSPNTCCVVDFTLTLLNRQHFALNEVYSKTQAKFTITNPMQGVSRWIHISDLVDRHFSNETGEFLFELSLSNMTTIFECDIQLSPATLSQYKCMLKSGLGPPTQSPANPQPAHKIKQQQQQQQQSGSGSARAVGNLSSELINLETNYFTFGAFDWSLTIVPLVMPAGAQASSAHQQQADSPAPPSTSSVSSLSLGSGPPASFEPVCRVYLNRLNGFDCLCRVKYRVILGHHLPASAPPGQQSSSLSNQFVDSRMLDQISDSSGRIRGHQFRHTNILKLISLRSPAPGQVAGACLPTLSITGIQPSINSSSSTSNTNTATATTTTTTNPALDLRVHIEMVCANTVSEAIVPCTERHLNEVQVSNCSDRNKQAWCVEMDKEQEALRLKLFFMDLQSVPRNHIRYISWVAYVLRKEPKSNLTKESFPVRNSPHSNYYLQDGIDTGTIMDTDIPVKELTSSSGYLDTNQALTVHIEWVDSLLLFSHLYNNYDALATIQRHQIGIELSAVQLELDELEKKYEQCRATLAQLLADRESSSSSSTQNNPHLSGVNTANTNNNSSSLNNNSSSRKTLRTSNEDYSLESSGSPELAGELPANHAQASADYEQGQPRNNKQMQQSTAGLPDNSKQLVEHQHNIHSHHQRQQQQAAIHQYHQQIVLPTQQLALLSLQQQQQQHPDNWQPQRATSTTVQFSGISQPQFSPCTSSRAGAFSDDRLRFSPSGPLQLGNLALERSSRPASSGARDLVARRRLPAQPGVAPRRSGDSLASLRNSLSESSRASLTSTRSVGGSLLAVAQIQQQEGQQQAAAFLPLGSLKQLPALTQLGHVQQQQVASGMSFSNAAQDEQEELEELELELEAEEENFRSVQQRQRSHLIENQQQQQQRLTLNSMLLGGQQLDSEDGLEQAAYSQQQHFPHPARLSTLSGPQPASQHQRRQQSHRLQEQLASLNDTTHDSFYQTIVAHPSSAQPLHNSQQADYLSSSSLLLAGGNSAGRSKVAASTATGEHRRFAQYLYQNQFEPF